jgi:hypothetical protein
MTPVHMYKCRLEAPAKALIAVNTEATRNTSVSNLFRSASLVPSQHTERTTQSCSVTATTLPSVAHPATRTTLEPIDNKPTVAAGSAASETPVPRIYNHDTVGFDSFEYHLPPGLLDEAFVEDLMKMEREEFVRKYSLVPRDVTGRSDGKLKDKQQQQQQQQQH